MARRVSKRKKPPKEKIQLKERWKIEQDVFDRRTAMTLAKLMDKGIVKELEYPVSEGKEAVVFKAKNDAGEDIAVKIYKVETSPFVNKMIYLEGDPRFRLVKRTPWEVVCTFARKEYKNLMLAKSAGAHVPIPVFSLNNVVVMKFLGEQGLPYPKLKDVRQVEGDWLDRILEDVKALFKAGLVHADLSAYNIVVGDRPYLLDFAQGVIRYHPHFYAFLERDVRNVLAFFERFGISRDPAKVLVWIKGGD